MRTITLFVLALFAAPLFAQNPMQPSTSAVPRNPRPDLGPVDGTVDGSLQRESESVLEQRATALLRRFGGQLERDPRGAPAVRSVIVALSPSDAALSRAKEAGFVIQREETLDSLSERMVTLVAPPGTKTRRALEQLRRLDPEASYDFDHLYFESSAERLRFVAERPVDGPVRSSTSQPEVKIGLVDGGIWRNHPALAALSIVVHGCDGKSVASSHGTAVASLLAGQPPAFKGAAPGAALYAADVYCGDDAPGGRVDDIARALAWLVGQNVAVMNVSLVGPPNLVLEGVIKRVLARSIIIVAAAGDDGRRAKPFYPAAYSGVLAVTAVDAKGGVLPEAGSGPHIAFAAPGADMLAAGLGSGYEKVRGTSFAAPLVAGLLASRLATAAPGASQNVIEAVALEAEDLGRKGQDKVYGRGLLARSLRVPIGDANIKK